PPPARVGAGKRAIATATRLGRTALGRRGRVHATHGDVLRRGRGALSRRGDRPLLDARYGARGARPPREYRARRGVAVRPVRVNVRGETVSSPRRRCGG